MEQSSRAVEGPLDATVVPLAPKRATFACTTGLADPLQPKAENQRFTAVECPDDDPFGDLGDEYSNHVLLYYGCDLAAAGIWEHDIAPCLLCAPLPPDRDPAVILTDETLHWGRHIHFVCCGNCGTRGPWADSESQALALWNAAHERHNVSMSRPQQAGETHE